MLLLFDVLLDDFIGHVAARHAEVPSGPHVPPPELLAQVRELTHQLVRTLPFQHLQQPTNRDLRWNRDEQMHVIFRDVPLDDRDFLITANFADQFPQPRAHFPGHDWLAVLGDPNQVQVNLEGRVRAAPVILHAAESSMTGATQHTC